MSPRRRVVTEDRLTIISGSSKQTKISPSGEEENSFQIPIDLVFEILLRLPAKSVAACRCVSKLWCSLISRPDFTELFLSRSVHRPQLLFICRKASQLFFFSSPQLQNPNENSSADSLVSFSFSCRISRPINGLVCLAYEETNETVRVICNPSTGQCLNLPNPTTRIGFRSFLGYEPIEKQFKVLLSYGGDEQLVLTLGTGELSWRKIECSKPHYVSVFSEICINGVLYYPATDLSSTVFPENITVCFDVSSEKFRFITAMEDFIKAAHDGTLINYNGKLASLVSENSRFVDRTSKSIELWVLQDVEKHECIRHTYVLPTWWHDIVGNGDYYNFVGVTRSNEIMLSPCFQTVPFYVFYFNIDTKTMRRAAIRGMEAFQDDRVLTFLDHVENVKPILMF